LYLVLYSFSKVLKKKEFSMGEYSVKIFVDEVLDEMFNELDDEVLNGEVLDELNDEVLDEMFNEFDDELSLDFFFSCDIE
jgi:hypothetical protein